MGIIVINKGGAESDVPFSEAFFAVLVDHNSDKPNYMILNKLYKKFRNGWSLLDLNELRDQDCDVFLASVRQLLTDLEGKDEFYHFEIEPVREILNEVLLHER